MPGVVRHHISGLSELSDQVGRLESMKRFGIKRWYLVVLLALLVGGGGMYGGWVLWRSMNPAVAAGSADPTDAALVALGGTVYADHCAACHGANLEGEPDWRTRKPDGRLPAPPHDATGHTWHHPDEQLFLMTSKGVAALAPPGYESDMPAYEGVLSDREIWAVIAYIKAQWPPEVLEAHRSRSR